eukprot:TRINITY_DN4230_c5_g1_i1.p2 TRINITY_DN4230_c5_g1~~TRINITY_DN4230_c5_g1_i1.p2  ORF type:complete len:523 (+),score=141.93 TRINITY_DN4230_c5_g1_i1:80-1648(+)
MGDRGEPPPKRRRLPGPGPGPAAPAAGAGAAAPAAGGGGGCCLQEAVRRCAEARSGGSQAAAEELLGGLAQVAAKWVHRGTAELYGSRLTGLGLGCGSGPDDVDVSISWPGYDPSRDGDQAVQVAMIKKLARLTRRLEQVGLVRGVHTRPSRRGMVLSGAVARGGLEGARIDITLNNRHGVQNSRVLRRASCTLPELAPAVWLLKRLAWSREWLGAQGQYLSSYALSLSVCAAAVAAGALPPLRPEPPGAPAPPQEFHGLRLLATAGGRPAPALQALRQAAAPEPSAGLLRRLLLQWCEMIAAVAQSSNALCPSAAQGARPRIAADGDAPLVIVDPVDGSNAAELVIVQHWRVTQSEAERLHRLLSPEGAAPSLAELCAARKHPRHRGSKGAGGGGAAKAQPAEAADTMEIRLPVPPSERGRLIGPGGVTHRQLQSVFGVRLQIPRKGEPDGAPVTIRGGREQCDSAARHIRTMLQLELPELPGGGPEPAAGAAPGASSGAPGAPPAAAEPVREAGAAGPPG